MTFLAFVAALALAMLTHEIVSAIKLPLSAVGITR
jgi:hypothetical protein